MDLAQRQHQLEVKLWQLQRDLDRIAVRKAAISPKNYSRLARIEGTPGATDNTFSITFLDGTFTEAAGNQTPTYTDRQNSAIGFAHNIVDPDTQLANGDIVIVTRWSNRWWIEKYG